MTITYYQPPRYQWQCLSTDTKPTDNRVSLNDLLFITDTGVWQIWNGASWNNYVGNPSGQGTISDLTSTGGTITITSPTGPTTNIEATGIAISALPNNGDMVQSDIIAFEHLGTTTTEKQTVAGLAAVMGTQRVLGTLRAANFNSTADQAIAIPATTTAWAPTAIWVTNASISLTTVIGGFYPAASKGGTALVAATQTYATATSSSIIVATTLAAGVATTRYAINTVYLSLTTAQGAAATADVYLIGVDLT